MQATATERYHRIEVGFPLSGGKFREVQDVFEEGLEVRFKIRYHTPEEEIKCVVVLSPLQVLMIGVGWDQRAGFGTTFDDLGPKVTSSHSVAVLTVARLLSLCTLCAILLQTRRIGEVPQ